MARYRKVDPRIWNDAKFMELGHLGQMLFLYVLTHPNMTMIGMLRSKKEALAFERDWDLQALNEAFDLALRLGLIEYDEVGLICLPNFIKYNEPESLMVVKSWGKCLDFLPECDLRAKYLNQAFQYCQNRGKAFEDAFLKAIDKTYLEANAKANGKPNDKANGKARPYQITDNRKQNNTNKHLSLNRGEDEAPAPVDVCGDFENPFCEEPPFDFEPDGQCFDAPIGQLIDECNLENNKAALEHPKHVLTASQIVVLAGTLGVRLGHSAELDAFAERKTLTVEIVTELITQFKAMQKPVGYLVGMLRNASTNPETVKGKQKEITPETMTDAQCSKFAQALAKVGRWCGKHRIPTTGKTTFELEAYLRDRLRDPQFWERAECKATLQNLGLIAKEA